MLASIDDDLSSLLLPCCVPQSQLGNVASAAAVASESSLSSSAHSSSSSSSTSESTVSEAESSESDPAFLLRIRHRERPRFKTIARLEGLSPDVMRFQFLREQHRLRIDDRAFCSKGAVGNRPPLYGWADFRLRLTRPFGLRALNPRITIKSRIGLTSRTFSLLSAAVRHPGPLLTATLHRSPVVPGPFVLLCLAGDGIGSAFPGGPGGGKIFSLWIKPVGLARQQQAPTGAIPILVSLGDDHRGRLTRVFRAWQPDRTIGALPAFLPLGGPDSACARPIVFVLGDLSFCCSIVTLPALNRPFPTTPGRVAYFHKPMCWLCGVGGGQLYSRDAWRQTRLSDLSEYSSTLDLPLRVIFYAPVHAVLNVFSQFLADLCHAYHRFRQPGAARNPVTEFVVGLFPPNQWDPLLEHPTTPSATLRRSRRPFHHIDPAFIFGFIRSEHAALLTCLLREHPFTWTAPAARMVAGLPLGRRRSALAAWLACLRWFDSIVIGSADQASLYGAQLMDLWLEMLAITRPIPPDGRPCGSPAPSHNVPVAGFGPASHVAVCSMPKLITFCRRFLPSSLLRDGQSFLKLVAEIWLENAQALIRRIAGDFNVPWRARHSWPLHLLQRALEGLLCRTAAAAVGGASGGDEAVADRDAVTAIVATTVAASAVPRGTGPAYNRAYRNCGLSDRVPDVVYAGARGTPEAVLLPPSAEGVLPAGRVDGVS